VLKDISAPRKLRNVFNCSHRFKIKDKLKLLISIKHTCITYSLSHIHVSLFESIATEDQLA